LEVPEKFSGKSTPHGLKTVDDFIREGAKLDRLEPLNWEAGDGALRTAFLCYSSGTSGLPVNIDLPV
jgi:ribosome assembly protein SQT1